MIQRYPTVKLCLWAGPLRQILQMCLRWKRTQGLFIEAIHKDPIRKQNKMYIYRYTLYNIYIYTYNKIYPEKPGRMCFKKCSKLYDNIGVFKRFEIAIIASCRFVGVHTAPHKHVVNSDTAGANSAGAVLPGPLRETKKIFPKLTRNYGKLNSIYGFLPVLFLILRFLAKLSIFPASRPSVFQCASSLPKQTIDIEHPD